MKNKWSSKDAKKFGIGMVVVKNSTHPGALASIAMQAARNGFAAFAFTNSDSLMLTFNGKKALLGTNPICFVAPNGEKEPFCLDMATTTYTWNKLLMYKKNKHLSIIKHHNIRNKTKKLQNKKKG